LIAPPGAKNVGKPLKYKAFPASNDSSLGVKDCIYPFQPPSPIENGSKRERHSTYFSEKGKSTVTTLDKETMDSIMKELAKERPQFCSEADFQFALGWKIQKRFPNAEIRFECPVTREGESIKVDIIVNLGGNLFPIELKWKLERHKADPINRGMMFHDIDRLGSLQVKNLELNAMNFAAAPQRILNRFAIWLSDNQRFWSESGTNSIHEYGEYKISWESYVDDFKFALTCISEPA